jgi:HEAT repeat protein
VLGLLVSACALSEVTGGPAPAERAPGAGSGPSGGPPSGHPVQVLLSAAGPSPPAAPSPSGAPTTQAGGSAGAPTSAEAAQPPAGEAGAAASGEVDVADVVIRSLSARKDKDDVGPLLPILALRLPRVDVYVLGEFARLGTQVAAYRPQVEALLDRPDESVRAACAKALGQMRDPAVSERLLGLLGSDPAAAVRAAAAEALGELQQPGSGPAVVQALSDPAPEVRQAAALAVAKLKWAAGAGAVASRLEMDRDVRVRELAASSLGELGGTQWADALAQALAKDPSSRVRLNAAEALGKVEARGALDVLIAGLDDPDIHVREAVVVALGRLGDSRAVAPLEELLGRVGTADTEPLATRTWQTLMRLVADDQSALRRLALARYRVGDRERAREAAQRLVDRFGSVEGGTEAWSGMVLLGVLASQRGNATPAEPLLRQALSSLDGGGVPAEQVRQLGEVLGVGGSLREYLEDQLVTALSASGRGREALAALDDMAKQDPAKGDRWWARRYEVLLQLAQAGEWPSVAFYLEGAAKSGAGHGGAYQKQLEELARQATEALDKMSSPELVGLWLRAADDVAASLEPRLRARGREVLAALVDALEAQDVRLRGRAVVLLRTLSGQSFAFDPEATPEERAAAVTRWRTWLEGVPTAWTPQPGSGVGARPPDAGASVVPARQPTGAPAPTPAPAPGAARPPAAAGVPANK